MLTVQLAKAVAPGVLPREPYVYTSWLVFAPLRVGEFVQLPLFHHLFRVTDVLWMREDFQRVFLEEAR